MVRVWAKLIYADTRWNTIEYQIKTAAQCVQDTNHNGISDIVDIMTTSARPGCWVYLPLAAANWRQPWPTPKVSENSLRRTRGRVLGAAFRYP